MNFEQITTSWHGGDKINSCLCHRKGNEFWANHNLSPSLPLINLVVFVTAKVMNFEQITTACTMSPTVSSCLCHRKGNEFWANHNTLTLTKLAVMVVFVTAKVMNFEQITTLCNKFFVAISCLCHRKGNEFWANHNRFNMQNIYHMLSLSPQR